jgi:TolB-like protein
MIEDFNHEDIRNELSKIVDTHLFKQSPKLVRFLKFVVERTLDEKGHLIKEYTIGKEILNKSEDYDPKYNASVRIHAMRLRKLLTDYYDQTQHEIKYRIDLPKGSYQPVFTKSSDGSVSRTTEKDAETNEKTYSICVVPFTGFFDQKNEDLSITGFCEFLTSKLSLFQDIRVVSFHSTCQYFEQGGELQDIDKNLDGSSYLTGNIEIEKGELRLSYQLFDAESKSIIWAQQTALTLNGTSAMQVIDNISSQIVSSLAGYSGLLHYKKVLDKSHPPPITNQMANAIFWFYHYQVQHTPALFSLAIQKLEKVGAENGNCALCWAVLATLYCDALVYNYKTEKDPIQTAISYVEKALQLDPDCHHAHVSHTWIQVFLRNKQGVSEGIEKINSLNPNSSYFQAVCSFGYALTGDYEKSIEKLHIARNLNPIPYWWMNFGEIFLALKTNNYDEMLFHARKTGTPKVIYEHVFEMICLYYMDNQEELKTLVKEYANKYPTGLAYLEKAFPVILFDPELAEKIKYALQQLLKMQ